MQNNFCGEVFWETPTKNQVDDIYILINQANSISLKRLFAYYKLNINEINRKTNCPLPNHKDSTASFNYYPHTNTFWCFGCSNGKSPVDLVAKIECISPIKAARKIVEIIGGTDKNSCSKEKTPDNLSHLYLKFSSIINNKITEDNFDQIDGICKTFDEINEKYHLDEEALLALISKLEQHI